MNLLLCSQCSRHVRAGSESCPFCLGTELAAAPSLVRPPARFVAALAIAALAGAACTSVGDLYGCPPDVCGQDLEQRDAGADTSKRDAAQDASQRDAEVDASPPADASAGD